jgi:hypothetical protein
VKLVESEILHFGELDPRRQPGDQMSCEKETKCPPKMTQDDAQTYIGSNNDPPKWATSVIFKKIA